MVGKVLNYGSAVAALVLVGCSIPGTLGLPCEVHEHCDGMQMCVEGICVLGDSGMMMPPLTSSGTTGEGNSGTTGDLATSTTDPGSSSSTTSIAESSSSSTGPACGIDACEELDVLLIVDNSDSMEQWLVPLSNSLPSMFTLFEQEFSGVCSYHVGIANAEQMPQDNTADCQFPGALIQRPSNCGGLEGDPPYYTEADGSPEAAFNALQCTFITQAFGGDEDERMLDSMLGALDPVNNAEGACNAGFRRPGANLAILYISDENDPTPSDEQDTVAELFQRYVDPALVVFIAVVGDPTNADPACQWVPDGNEGTGAETPSALSGFLALSNIPLSQQARVDICQSKAYEFEDAFDVFSTICE